MKKSHVILIAAALVMALLVAPVVADGVPQLPVQIYGTAVDSAGQNLPVGTVITAELNGETFSYTITEAGKIGASGPFGEKFLISSTSSGGVLTFKVGDIFADKTITYQPGEVANVSLIFDNATSAVETVVETETIPQSTGLVTLEETETITAVQIPLSAISSTDDPQLHVTETTAVNVTLPSGITSDEVSVMLEISVTDAAGNKIEVNSPGYFLLNIAVDSRKKLVVGHKKSNGVWEDCTVTSTGTNLWKVEFQSLSPFAVVILDKNKTSPFITEEKNQTIVDDTPSPSGSDTTTPSTNKSTTTTYTTTPSEVTTPTKTTTEQPTTETPVTQQSTTTTVPTSSAKSPFPVMGILIGLGAAAFFLRRR